VAIDWRYIRDELREIQKRRALDEREARMLELAERYIERGEPWMTQSWPGNAPTE